MTTCNATNGTYQCHRAARHEGEHASVATNAGKPYALRWGGARGTYSQRLAPILDRGLE